VNTSTVQVVGGNLFDVAATYLGSALQWINIAQANGISDPFLIGIQTLRLPVPNPAFDDGVPPQ
jgi:hypothetical protein